MPHKAGLWEQRVSTGGPTRLARVCLGGDVDTVLTSVSAVAGGPCRGQQATKVAEGMWKFTTVCDGGQDGKVSVDGAISGDFATRYQVLADTAAVGASPERRRRLVVDATWKGACPAGMKPGDAVTPDGVRVSAANLVSVATH